MWIVNLIILFYWFKIVFDCSWFFLLVRNILNIILKFICKLILSYIWDVMDILNYILNIVDENIKLKSFDVISLYIDILYSFDIEVIFF